MAKVILIYPCNPKMQSSLYPPLGLAYIASYLKSKGINIEVIDLTFSELPEINNYGNFYIISCTTALYLDAKKVTAQLKKEYPNCLVCLGGAHPSVMPEYVLNDDQNTDVVVVGEGEQTIYEIVQGKSLSDVQGIYYRNNDNIVSTGMREPIHDLDTLPFPDQSLFPIEQYFSIKGFRELTMISSRGCPHDCIYCQPTIRKIFGKTTRFRSPDNVVDEMEYLIKAHNLDMITFSDDTFTASKSRVREICQRIIDRKINILWKCQTRSNLDLETLSIMKKAGCFLISVGVESGSNLILENIHKGITTKDTKNVFGMCKQVGILTYAFLMVGNLGETRSTINDTKFLLRQIKPFSGNVSITTPYPGSYLYETSSKETDWSRYAHIMDNTIHMNDFSDEIISQWKFMVEQALEINSKKSKDIYNLLKDFTIIGKLINMSLRDRMFIVRIIKLLISFSEQKTGFKTINPYLRK